MKYYEGIDYTLSFGDFPHMGVPGAIASNNDGTATIYINTLYCKERQNKALRHELRHFVLGHFDSDCSLTLEEKESVADNIDDTSLRFAPDFSFVEYIENAESEQEMSSFEVFQYVMERLETSGVTGMNLNLDDSRTYTLEEAEEIVDDVKKCILSMHCKK